MAETSAARSSGDRPMTPLPLQEALRTVGNQLESERRRAVRLTVDATGIAVDAAKEYGYRQYSWDQLTRLSRSLREQRRAVARVAEGDAWTIARWSILLRVTGQILDRQAVDACVIDAAVDRGDALQSCEVRVTVADKEIVSTASVQEQLQLLQLRQSAAQQTHQNTAAAQQRPWWARWRQS